MAENAENFGAECGVGVDGQARVAGEQRGAEALGVGARAQEEGDVGSVVVAEPGDEAGAFDEQRAALVAVVGVDAGERERLRAGGRGDADGVAAFFTEALAETFAGEGEGGVARGVEDGVVEGRLHPR